jgi:hypothetical protein
MKYEFIPYEQALELKELGFDEPCFAYLKPNVLTYEITIGEFDESEYHSAPLYQQAFRWFRKKYQLLHSITEYNKDGSLIIKIYQNKIVVLENMTNFDITEYEEAELACLIKLIEIVKTK